MDSDVESMKPLLGIEDDIVLPKDDVGAHRTPKNYRYKLSDVSRRNIEKCLDNEYKIFDWCLANRERLFERAKTRIAASELN